MKNTKFKILLPVCCLLFAAVFGGCGLRPAAEEAPKPAVQALPRETAQPSLKEQALSAYRDILKAAPAMEGEHAELSDASFGYDENLARFGNHYELFALADLNGDDVPELIALSTVNFRWTPVSVYTWADGAAVLLKDPLDTAAHGTFEQQSTANGAYLTYICSENHIHSVWRGMTPMGEAEDNYAYALTGTTLTAVDCPAGEGENTVYFHDIALANTAENADAVTRG